MNVFAKQVNSPELVAACLRFIESGGHTTQSFGLGQVLGQVFALLYLSPRPLCLDEIVEELGVSKASVSTTVRQLEDWSAVHHVWVKGDRRDFYEAETDFKAMLRHGVLAPLRKKMETAAVRMEHVESSLHKALEKTGSEQRAQARIVADRLQQARKFHSKINGLLNNPLLDHLL
jgi:DNA-binding transcriptional regulator GbsR (MarR family)